MENFVVSARKYRPATFDTVVGQEHITTTLRNAIRTNHLASAFLFCGPRGVGKTTCARILAKTINCQNLTAETEACDTCESCVSFRQNTSFNVHELDAASNNSVDDIRMLIDQVRIPPQAGAKYKVYIIDEVHMLSSAAFNAFLKTLEEPPSYAIFILATTEKHKILPTILSRCQIFDFNRIQPGHIAAHLANIATQEGITTEADALDLIAQKADGGLRDALSMFDLNVTFSTDRTLRYKEVLDNLHILDYDYYFRLTDLLLSANLPQSLLTLDEILRKGFDGHQFILGLTRHFRDLLVSRDAATVQLLQVTENVRTKYLDQAARAPLSFLLSALSIGGQCDLNFKQAKDQRLHLELCLMKLAALRHTLNWEAMPDLAPPTPASHPTINANTAPAGVEVSTPSVPVPDVPTPGAEKKNGSPLAHNPAPASTPVLTHPITSEPVNGYHTNGNGASYPTPNGNGTHGQSATANHPAETAPLTHANGKPVMSVPKIPAGSKLRSTISLQPKAATNTDNDADVAVVDNRPDLPFTEAELQAAWNRFKVLRNAQTGMVSEQLILGRDFKLDGTTIHLALDNNLMAGLMVDLKPDLLGYLREQLQNRQIQLEYRVEAVETKKLIYSPQDKFNFMAEKNPALHELRKALGLEVDY
ncbi:DNA polymerase III subunit gamma/tau [Rudanella paleaurantiibacter]|uniref:DNA polymerase III subunit gamma/tau n=1 Tax=Rudanella paleaurantiibacter TaxID=2614655 RepID=A0A7J5U2D8_9BACT|nr:DNA polymerase III subunit gamma/tau [Rudanella paleaurantiibacter]KAB7731742.1 DNA polymerase III subunit gamma/tau [Rudanella paleaurantiibacter]